MAMSLLFLSVSCVLHSTCWGQVDLNQEILEKLNILEKQGLDQTNHMRDLEHKLQLQEEIILSQASELGMMRNHVAKQDQVIKDLQSNREVSSSDRTPSKSKLVDLVETKSRQSRLVLDNSQSIAFYSYINMPSLDNIAVNQTVVFETVGTNLGGGYNKQTGVFTAPMPGVYLLSTSFGSFLQHHHEVHLAMLKNNQVISRAVAHGDSGHLDQGSTVVVTTLNKGDTIKLVSIGDPASSLAGSAYSNFMGVALFEM